MQDIYREDTLGDTCQGVQDTYCVNMFQEHAEGVSKDQLLGTSRNTNLDTYVRVHHWGHICWGYMLLKHSRKTQWRTCWIHSYCYHMFRDIIQRYTSEVYWSHSSYCRLAVLCALPRSAIHPSCFSCLYFILSLLLNVILPSSESCECALPPPDCHLYNPPPLHQSFVLDPQSTPGRSWTTHCSLI